MDRLINRLVDLGDEGWRGIGVVVLDLPANGFDVAIDFGAGSDGDASTLLELVLESG